LVVVCGDHLNIWPDQLFWISLKKKITILIASKKMSILSGEFEIEQGLNLKLEQGRQT